MRRIHQCLRRLGRSTPISHFLSCSRFSLPLRMRVASLVALLVLHRGGEMRGAPTSLRACRRAVSKSRIAYAADEKRASATAAGARAQRLHGLLATRNWTPRASACDTVHAVLVALSTVTCWPARGETRAVPLCGDCSTILTASRTRNRRDRRGSHDRHPALSHDCFQLD